jgi:hypothetical protein
MPEARTIAIELTPEETHAVMLDALAIRRSSEMTSSQTPTFDKWLNTLILEYARATGTVMDAEDRTLITPAQIRRHLTAARDASQHCPDPPEAA